VLGPSALAGWSISGRPNLRHGLLAATPILALDMYEHAYHLDFGARAAAYVDQ
jgi:superoxide dismutase